MILVGNQRGGAKDLARHLMKPENEHIAVHELRGFASENLSGALNEVYAVSRATKCQQYLYSLSLNPPPEENVSTESFEAAIDRIEKKLKLDGQPRAIVFHEKEGRRHCHAVWSRIDAHEMKAVPLPYTKLKLRDISRELYREHGWRMPSGFVNSKERDPRSFSLAEWQQAKRNSKDPRDIKTTFQDCWAISDTQNAFEHALQERGYILARGDRRGFVAIDYTGEVYAVSKWTGQRTKTVRERMTDADRLPTVEKARKDMARTMAARLKELARENREAVQERMSMLSEQRRELVAAQKAERRKLIEAQKLRWAEEARTRQARFAKGVRGFMDRLTGKHGKTKMQNEAEANAALNRDRDERDAVIFKQLEVRRKLQQRIERLRGYGRERTEILSRDHHSLLALDPDRERTKRSKRTASPTHDRPRRSR